jgi:hypothetical protein
VIVPVPPLAVVLMAAGLVPELAHTICVAGVMAVRDGCAAMLTVCDSGVELVPHRLVAVTLTVIDPPDTEP